MKRFSVIWLALLVVGFAVAPAYGQAPNASADSSGLGKLINVGANPVCRGGMPADTLAAHPDWLIKPFDFKIPLTCTDKEGKLISGHVREYEPLVVSIIEDRPDSVFYQVHYIFRCGNKAFRAPLALGKPLPPPGPAPPPAVCDTLTAPADSESVVIVWSWPEPESEPWTFPVDGWVYVASSQSFRSPANDWYGGGFLRFPFTRWCIPTFVVSSGWANFHREGGLIKPMPLVGTISRWQTGLTFRPADNMQFHALAGRQYDRRAGRWQPGTVWEAYLRWPAGRFWSEENVAYQDHSHSFWFRSRHFLCVWSRGLNSLSVGGQGTYDEFRQPPLRDKFYTTWGDGVARFNFQGPFDRDMMVLVGVGIGSEQDVTEHGNGRRVIVEFGFRPNSADKWRMMP